MAIANGTFLKIKIGSAVLVGETSHSFSSDANMIATSNKETGRDSTFIPSRTTRTIDFSSMYDPSEDTNYNFHDVIAAQDAGTSISWELVNVDANGDAVTGSYKFSGSGYFASASLEAGDDDVATFSGSIQVSGAVTTATVSA